MKRTSTVRILTTSRSIGCFPFSHGGVRVRRVGSWLSVFSDFARRREDLFSASLGAAGIAAILLSMMFDASPIRLYAVYDYWHSNPDFLLARCGVLLIILSLIYAWSRWGFAQKGFRPVIQLGRTSLLVYWVHIEFVYGIFDPAEARLLDPESDMGLLVIFPAMLALSMVRTRYKKKTVRALQPQAPAAPAPAT